MIKYFVRTTNERILDESFKRELGEDFTLLVDLNHNSGRAFIEQLGVINDFDSVLMEDDIILCKDFKKRIEEVINTYPEELINFFTSPGRWFSTTQIARFCYNQCTYFPKGLAKQIKDTITSKHIENVSQENMMLRSLIILHRKHIIYRPCLVQHIDKGSLMNHNVKFPRRTPYFVDYLDELGISYEEAKSAENSNKLVSLMHQKFKEI